MLSNKELNLSGWMCVVAAVSTVPLIVFGFYIGMVGEEITAFLSLTGFLLSAIYTVVFVYIYLQFKKLLNQHANFHDVDLYITLLIWINIISTLISHIPDLFPSTEIIFSIALFVMFIPMGIILIIMGIKLLKCEAEFNSKLKYFSYFTIASGVLLASVIFFLFSFVTSIITDIILAAIFFSEIDRERVEKEDYGISS